jgi:hypothetical protein
MDLACETGVGISLMTDDNSFCQFENTSDTVLHVLVLVHTHTLTSLLVVTEPRWSPGYVRCGRHL